MEVIEKILENNKNSIIIIQGDHGTCMGSKLEEPDQKKMHLAKIKKF